MLVYFCHQFGGNELNRERVELQIKALYIHHHNLHENITFISPIHATGFLYNDMSYQDGMDSCFELLGACKVMVVDGDFSKSRGCMMELDYCSKHGIPVVEFNDLMDNPLAVEAALWAKRSGLITGVGELSTKLVTTLAHKLKEEKHV